MFQAFSHYSEKYHLSNTSIKNERYLKPTLSVHLPIYILCTSEKNGSLLLYLEHSMVFI